MKIVYSYPLPESDESGYLYTLVSTLRDAYGVKFKPYNLYSGPGKLLAGGAGVMHIHFPENVTRGGGRSRRLVKLLFFIFGIAAAKIKRVKIVWTCHNLISHKQRQDWLDKFVIFVVLHSVDSVIHLSISGMKSFLERHNVLNRRRINHHIIYHGDYSKVYNFGISTNAKSLYLRCKDRGRKVFLCFGSIEWYKGYDVFAKRFVEIKNEDEVLYIIGKPSDREVVKAISEIAEKHDDVVFIPARIASSDIPSLMRDVDVLVLPYRRILNSGVFMLGVTFNKVVVAPKTPVFEEYMSYIDNNGIVLFDRVIDRDILNKALNSAVGEINMSRRLCWEVIGAQTYRAYQCQ